MPRILPGAAAERERVRSARRASLAEAASSGQALARGPLFRSVPHALELAHAKEPRGAAQRSKVPARLTSLFFYDPVVAIVVESFYSPSSGCLTLPG